MRMRSEFLPVRGMHVGHFLVQVQSSPVQSRVHGPYFTNTRHLLPLTPHSHLLSLPQSHVPTHFSQSSALTPIHFPQSSVPIHFSQSSAPTPTHSSQSSAPTATHSSQSYASAPTPTHPVICSHPLLTVICSHSHSLLTVICSYSHSLLLCSVIRVAQSPFFHSSIDY